MRDDGGISGGLLVKAQQSAVLLPGFLGKAGLGQLLEREITDFSLLNSYFVLFYYFFSVMFTAKDTNVNSV